MEEMFQQMMRLHNEVKQDIHRLRTRPDKLDDNWTHRVALLADQLHHVEFPETRADTPSPDDPAQSEDMREFSVERPAVERPKASIDPKMALANKLTNQAPQP